jgi:hypothetical protein
MSDYEQLLNDFGQASHGASLRNYLDSSSCVPPKVAKGLHSSMFAIGESRGLHANDA